MHDWFPFFVILLILSIVCLFPVAGIMPGTFRLETMNNSIITFPENKTLQVGILVMKSGFVSDIGTEYTRAFEMVQKDNPDSMMVPVIMDAGSNASVATSSWEEMVNTTPYLPVVTTVSSWTTNIVYPKAADSGIIHLALGSASVNRSHESDHLVRFTPGVEQESPVLASYLARFNSIAVVGGNDDYANGYYGALVAKLPGRILQRWYYNPNDIKGTLDTAGIVKANPDVIVLLSFSEGGKVAELLRNEGIKAPLLGTRVIGWNSLLETKAAEGLIFTTPALNKSHSFFKRYRDEYGEPATFYGAEGFDAMTTLYSAVSGCEGSPDCIYTRYQNSVYGGALGSVRFNGTGVASYPITFVQVNNGKFMDYQVTGIIS